MTGLDGKLESLMIMVDFTQRAGCGEPDELNENIIPHALLSGTVLKWLRWNQVKGSAAQLSIKAFPRLRFRTESFIDRKMSASWAWKFLLYSNYSDILRCSWPVNDAIRKKKDGWL